MKSPKKGDGKTKPNPEVLDSPKTAGLKRKRKTWLIALIVAVLVIGLAAALILDWPKNKPAIVEKPNLVPPTALQCAESLPTDELAGQLLMVGLTASGMKDQAPIFKQYQVGGAVLVTSPVDPYDGSIKQFKTQGGSPGVPLLISTDEEGGIVQRFTTLGVLPAPADVAQTMSPEQAGSIIAAHGAKLKSVGVDMVLGPLADVAPVNSESPLGSRIFPRDPQTVSDYDEAYISGWESSGLLPTLKHFPGLGSATGNTDYQPATTPPLSVLTTRDFVPYKNLVTSGTAVMVGSQVVPGWSGGPALFSSAVITYLRNNLGYKNSLIITDSLEAAAVASTDNVPSAVVKALAAGNDMVLLVDPDVTDMTPASLTILVKEAETAIETAVSGGTLIKQQLAQSFLRKLSAQHLSACEIKDQSRKSG